MNLRPYSTSFPSDQTSSQALVLRLRLRGSRLPNGRQAVACDLFGGGGGFDEYHTDPAADGRRDASAGFAAYAEIVGLYE